jgi:hypothetical protein
MCAAAAPNGEPAPVAAACRQLRPNSKLHAPAPPSLPANPRYRCIDPLRARRLPTILEPNPLLSQPVLSLAVFEIPKASPLFLLARPPLLRPPPLTT